MSTDETSYTVYSTKNENYPIFLGVCGKFGQIQWYFGQIQWYFGQIEWYFGQIQWYLRYRQRYLQYYEYAIQQEFSSPSCFRVQGGNRECDKHMDKVWRTKRIK